MQLRQLIQSLPKATIDGPQDQEITGVFADSRQIEPGGVFVAVRGSELDGQKFVADAIERGAAAIVSEVAPEPGVTDRVCWAHVPDARAAVAAMACAYYEDPSAKMNIVGITGTNGKTTTAFLVHSIMQKVWTRAGLLGTVQVDDGEAVRPATHTTPGALELQAEFQTMHDNACRGVAMEVSSHALEQKRVDGTQFDVAVFSNFTQDHLDYHGTMEAYYEAKRRLFDLMESQVGEKKTTAVINIDDPYGQRLIEEFKGRLHILSYGHGVHADLRLGREVQTVRGTEFQVTYKDREYLVRTPYIGRFNVYNCGAALAASIACGIKARSAVRALADAPQVPGRMENVGSRDGATVFVDYAHTPDALEHACAALRELQPKRLITVFGCGGDRDQSKRKLMGKAAAEASDLCVVTSDNPRSEDPREIIRHIEVGMEGKRYQVIPDRSLAIRVAVNVSEEGDIILIAGKGHETYQEIDGKRIDFDDRRAAYQALKTKSV
ncbi:UDP-N-acetylmuramoyl-L-alanyl-D-glutamate--2,6-diaminopimelate ligase [Verrucomicrobiaceae bacterium N1E253]|uniref:UDP-N-acetylmuramoyl-L-alanyl-D-glutamate--2,6-diaminopimelate ligase n=1 Tax=Oceaniferula marina TaxID=2748318 RepID=A0A851GQ64_9BACT|nr:UDP-N-acetylmuramoyl-L-alanyl-D-glutamate--2,6-diaminopimelate ligase [Oceaniferula marina]NWK56294.1 UDP-N-acetylmuramoyl-L-alanyl-D-glutamate--2,6-diaminopimelate ligase [Oceaniferula marina]